MLVYFWQDSSQLKDLWKKICHNNTGMEFQDHRYWLRTYPNCIVGKELVNWLLTNGTISTRCRAEINECDFLRNVWPGW